MRWARCLMCGAPVANGMVCPACWKLYRPRKPESINTSDNMGDLKGEEETWLYAM